MLAANQSLMVLWNSASAQSEKATIAEQKTKRAQIQMPKERLSAYIKKNQVGFGMRSYSDQSLYDDLNASMIAVDSCSYNNMISEVQIRDQFLRSEASVGITREAFVRRFLYAGDPASENYLLDRFSATPSQLQGLTIEQEKGIGYLMGEVIFRAGESLRIPVSTTVVAASIAHYFYSRVGFLDYDFRDVAMGATFLACKSEETLRKSYEVSAVFDQVFKAFEGQRMPIKVQVLNSQEYEYMRKKVIQMENEILFALGFEVYRLFDIPHRYIGGLFKTLDRHPDCRRICQRAWTHLNDFYRTNCPLFYPGPTIAAAAVYLALLKLGIKMPTAAWWVLLEAHLEGIEELVGQLEAFYEAAAAHKYSLQWAAAQLNELGDRHQLVNVFPVNYYRKIMLDANSQLKIKKVTIPPPQPLPLPAHQQGPQPQPTVEENDSQESRERSRQRKKKKEKGRKQKKEKRKKKDKKRYSDESRSNSKSFDRNKSNKKKSSSEQEEERPQPQLRNNDETPKINKVEQPVPQPMIDEKKSEPVETVKQMQVGNAKGLLSMISDQLKRHEIKRQKQEIIPMQIEPKVEPKASELPIKDSESDSDEGLLAQLIQIRKSKGMKGNQSQE